MHFETKAIHAGLQSSHQSASIVPPISPSTIFEIDGSGRKDEDFHYTRLNNPNRLQFEQLIAALEEGESAAAFASGIAAASAVFQSLTPGDHVIFPDDIYTGNRNLIEEIMTPWGLQASFIRMTSPDTIEKTLKKNTKLIWIETPSNPMMRITDIRAVSRIAAAGGIRVAVDNTWPTPVNQLPLKLGADIVIHSTTKYFGGHSDLLGGAVISKKQDSYFDKIRRIQQLGGAVPSPQDCWMLSRSTRTLAYRMRGHNEHAKIIASFLKTHPKIEDVYYPGLSSHKGHEIAARQMTGFGGMISFIVNGSRQDAIDIVGRSKLIKRATSLGGVESTWEHRQSSEGDSSLTPKTLIRLSTGLEHPDDLLEDLEQAFG